VIVLTKSSLYKKVFDLGFRQKSSEGNAAVLAYVSRDETSARARYVRACACLASGIASTMCNYVYLWACGPPGHQLDGLMTYRVG